MAVQQAAMKPRQRLRVAWAEAPGPATRALGAPAFSWEHPQAGLAASAFGEAARREGGPLRSLLDGLDGKGGIPGGIEELIDWPDGAPEPPGPWFGALAFDRARPMGTDWSGFASARFILPQLLCWSRGGRHFAAAFGDGCEQRLERALEALREAPAPLPQGGPPRLRALPGDRERWTALVERALAAIERGDLDKVVLARAIRVEADREIDTRALLEALAARQPTCRTFLIRGDGGAVFLGSTPETLCRIEGSLLRTEALAGSARPGDGTALLSSQKDLREHRWVVDHVVHGLEGVASAVQRREGPDVRELVNVAHLVTPISARLAPGRSVADVVAALHPTPAVAGVPTAMALRFLAQHEPLDRGLYAGLVGWIGPGRAELSVALRSALVRGATAQLFVGAGIVRGSSPNAEWAETELKSRALLDALGVAP
jgi:isochorismate synthase